MRRTKTIGLTACLALGSCASVDDPWVFCLTREADERGYWSYAREPACSGPTDFIARSEAEAVFAVAVVGFVICAPPIIDTLMLPITVPHDLLFAR